MLGSNFTKLLLFLKRQISFSQILHQSLGWWDTTLLYFLGKIIYFNEPIKVQIWWNLASAVKSLKCCTLMGSFCLNHVQFQLKKVLKNYLQKSAKFKKEKLTSCLKNDMIYLINFNLNSKQSENLHFDGIFLSKVRNVWATII